ncbi:MAG: DUF3747 domain-containing protein [Cyanobacteria bacterium J06649_4]
MKSIIRRLTTLTALTTTALAASAIASTSAIAQSYGQQSLDADSVVAVAEPVSNGRFYRLLILQQLNNQRACFDEQVGSPTVIEPLLLNFDFSGICGRSSDSNGYSIRIGDEDLSRRYRLQVTRRGEQLVLVALPGALPGRGGDLPVLEIGRSNGVANDFVKLTLDPGWRMTRRTLNGNAQGHIYLSNDDSLETVVAQAGGSRPSLPTPSTPSPSTPAPSTPDPSGPPILNGGSLPTPSSPLPSRPPTTGAAPTPGSGGQNTYYQVIVPSSSSIIRARVRQVAPDAFLATVNGNRVIQAGLFQEEQRANQLVAQLASRGLNTQVIEGQRSAPPPRSTASSEPFYQVVVPESGSNTRDRVNAIESGAFRTTVNGQRVIQAGRFRDRNRAEQLQRRLSAARLPARIIEGSGPIAVNPNPSPGSPSIPRARQGQLTVVIDPGHGGRDPGAVGIGGLREKDINNVVSRRVQSTLSARGINVVMTRSDDRELGLQPRVNIAERADADIFVSIHSNAISLSRPDVNGLETFYYSSGFRLAQTIQNNILQRTDLRDRGVRRARFYVLVNTSMPAVLVETGFVTGREDAARFRNPQAVNEIADGISAGILQYLNVR